ncbi:MAG: hypothetical protein FWH40_04815 [Coriobacteriia bacterium]|nr:hypothetical protein [Coriobacteriia bacterium]
MDHEVTQVEFVLRFVESAAQLYSADIHTLATAAVLAKELYLTLFDMDADRPLVGFKTRKGAE